LEERRRGDEPVLFTFSARLVGRGALAGAATPASSSKLERWTRSILRLRYVVLAFWLAVSIAGVLASVALPRHLVNSFAVPHTSSDRAAAALARGFGERADGTFTVVFPVHAPPDAHLVDALRQRLVRAAHQLPGGRLASFRAGGTAVYGEIGTSLRLQQARALTERLREVLRRDGGIPALVSGEPAVQHDLEPRLQADLHRGEAFALPLAVLVLAAALGVSLALVVPFVAAASTIAGTLVMLYLAARITAITPYTLNVVELIGLGLAIDYSLIMLRRYREELAIDGDRTEAIVRTVASAGRAVVFSGLAVATGLALLLFVPVPFIRSLGLGGSLIPLVSIVAALTLQPVLLSVCGPSAVRLRRSHRRTQAVGQRAVDAVVRRPGRTAAAAAAVLLLAATPALYLRVTPGSLEGLPRSLQATQGLEHLRDAFGPGALTPTEVVIDAGAAGAARAPAVHGAVERLSDELFKDPEVYVVALGHAAPYVSANGRYARVFVVGRHQFGAEPSQRLVHRIRDSFVPAARFPHGTTVLTAGAAPQGADFLAQTTAFFPWVALASLGLTCLLLGRAFRSVVLPVKAVLLNGMSVAASYGLLVLIYGGAPVEAWVPVLLFALLFGLSLDYEVFLVSRMREAWDAGRSTTEAVKEGLERTGAVITAAALVMAVAFGGLVVGSVPGLRQLGVGLVLAVLIDATVVRILLVPSVMVLLGRRNWWLPQRRARKRTALLAASLLLALAAPTGAAASPTIRLAIAHVVQHCHVWRRSTKLLGPSAKLTVARGTRLVIRADCPMDFDYVQTAGPRLALGSPRTFAGDARVIVFRKAGVYRLRATNVQAPEDRGLVTLGETNTLTLVVVVR
jgi:uncharacterized membrane protein YdfJ with MMPL/SSD domain